MRMALSQQEIEALFSAAQSGGKAENLARRKVSKCDLVKSKTLLTEQVQAVNTLHESFARRLSDSLGAYLRVGLDVNLVSAEQLRWAEFLGRIPESTYLASLRVLQIDARALIQLDLPLIFPMLDLALGGSGFDPITVREPTEIEELVIETVVGLIARDLQASWAPVIALDIQFDQRQTMMLAQGLMLRNERILHLKFEIGLLETHGSLSVALPAVVANALLAKLEVLQSEIERMPSRHVRRKIFESLMESKFSAELSLPTSHIRVGKLLEVKPGDVLVMSRRTDQPVYLNIAGKPMFQAYPVSRGVQRGARVVQRSTIAAAGGGEEKA